MKKYILFIFLMGLISCQLEHKNREEVDTLNLQSKYQGHILWMLIRTQIFFFKEGDSSTYHLR